jgi:transposase
MLEEIAPPATDVKQLQSIVRSQHGQIDHMQVLIAKLRHLQPGRSSERLAREIEQLELRLEDMQTAIAPVEAAVAAMEPAPAPSRERLPEHLARERVVHQPPSTCPDCGGEMRPIGEDVSEMLDYVPARFKVIRHVRPKLACVACQRIVQQATPSVPLQRGLPGGGLLAHLLVSKFADHLPLYRQSEIYAREGVELDRSTLADWVGRSLALLEPLVESLGRYVLASQKLHADDAPLAVLDPGRGTTKTGRLWTYVRDDRPAASAQPPGVLFRYSPDRKGERLRDHLKGFSGILQAASCGFNQLYQDGRILEAACWAHARRSFYDIHQARGSPIAAEALERIGQLYAIEAETRGKPPDERRQIRQARAGPLLASLRTRLQEALPRLSSKSELAIAIGYVLTRWAALTRYRDDGRIEIDNGAAERALRAVALARKNLPFAGSDGAGERAAAMYSLIGTAKLNGLDAEAYLCHVIERIADHPIKRIEQLLPWTVAGELQLDARLAA